MTEQERIGKKEQEQDHIFLLLQNVIASFFLNYFFVRGGEEGSKAEEARGEEEAL